MQQGLTEDQVEQFINEGYVQLDNAFSPELAAAGRAILWRDTGCDPNDSSTWTRAVIRLGNYDQEPFKQAVNTPILHAAFNQLVGEGRWLPRNSLGTFPIRFRSDEEPGDTGWHVEASFPGDDPNNYLAWRTNVYSKGRALLMLFLFSDVGEQDAPTRIRAGSHLDVARVLSPAGEKGLSFFELAAQLTITEGRKDALATGKAGTVFLCHTFLVHAAQPHRGANPRFMAQPPLLPAGDFQIYGENKIYSPVEIAIRKGLGLQ